MPTSPHYTHVASLGYLNVFKRKYEIYRCLTKLLQWEISVLSGGKCWNRPWKVCTPGTHWESQDSTGVWGTDVSYGAVKCSPNEREFPIFGHFGHELERTKTLPYQLPFIYILIWCSESIPGVVFRIVGLWNTLAMGNQVNFVELISLTLKPN